VTVRVIVADDQELVRTGFRLILSQSPDISVVGEAATGHAAVALARELRPDVILMDIRMPELDGIRATRQILATHSMPAPRVLILTTFDLDEYVLDALRSGASGFLLKDVPAEDLLAGVLAVQRGDALLAPSITRRLIERFTAGSPARTVALPDLTPRESEVFRLIAVGMSNAEIAACLIIGENTVKTHVARLLMKLGVRDRVQAVIIAYESGFVRPGGSPDNTHSKHDEPDRGS
jgi:DNA-binding NarL/FixJ family response regulator